MVVDIGVNITARRRTKIVVIVIIISRTFIEWISGRVKRRTIRIIIVS